MTLDIKHNLQRFWQGLMTLTGDDAYQRYLDHWQAEHGGTEQRPMTRREFYMAEQQRKWNRPNRCC